MSASTERRVTPERAVLVVNTRSRTGQEAFTRARQELLDRGVPLAAAYPVKDPARIPETVQEALRRGTDLLVLGGGDGTVSSVVDYLADELPALALLPLGTANDFARTLQIPSDLEQACRVIAEGRVVDVDLGLAADNYFVNVASVGLSVAVTEGLSSQLKKRLGALAYPLASARAYVQHRPFSGRLRFPDGDHDVLELDGLLQVAVGNGRFYGGGNVVAPDAGIDDHTLDVYAIRKGRRRDLLGVARGFRSGNFTREENVTHVRTQRLVLETEPALSVNIDGEIVAQTPQEFRVVGNALRVVIPRDATAAGLDAG